MYHKYVFQLLYKTGENRLISQCLDKKQSWSTHLNSYTRHCAIAVSNNSLLLFHSRGQSDHAGTERKSPLHMASLKNKNKIL